ncbi:MAG: hypothetical protein ACOCQD_02725 [archaeon]
MSDTIGFDVGTGNLISAKYKENKIEFNYMRNCYLPISSYDIESSELSNTPLDYIEFKDEDGEIQEFLIISEDALRFSNIFGKTPERPMQHGMISTKNISAIDIITLMVEKLISDDNKKIKKVIYSIPADPIDSNQSALLYHQRVFESIFNVLEYDCKAINEGLAVIYSECEKTNYSGIGISFGAGLTNICCAYKGTPVLTFSINKGGDWIDNEVGNALNTTPSRVSSIKERNLDLSESSTKKSKNRKETMIRDALKMYYKNLIDYVLNLIVKKFSENSDGLQIDEEIPIVISGGTSGPNGFVELFKEVLSSYKEFPYEISEVRHAENFLEAVALGCLKYGNWKKEEKNERNFKDVNKNDIAQEVPGLSNKSSK